MSFKCIELPSTVYEYLEGLSKKLNVSVQDLITRFLINTLEHKEREEFLKKLSNEYLELGKRYEKSGDLVYAGELYWRGLAYLMQALAERLGFYIDNYQDYFSLIDYLAYKTNETELVKMFINAERLHGEYHPRPQGEQEFKFRVENLLKLFERLEKMLS
ncbi:MAG: PaREP1 family protein [Stygiolobus sp.]|jgi:hypothetical protein|nr:PaREP1 family protein [Stygiolobus sp.]